MGGGGGGGGQTCHFRPPWVAVQAGRAEVVAEGQVTGQLCAGCGGSALLAEPALPALGAGTRNGLPWGLCVCASQRPRSAVLPPAGRVPCPVLRVLVLTA